MLERNLTTMTNEDEILEKGGVFALVGPTGVGKTTSTAKLAARCVMRHGPEKLALITTDAYRIGGHEQLRIYGKILGVMVHSVKDEADLRIALKELRNKHTVLIDTVGVSPARPDGRRAGRDAVRAGRRRQTPAVPERDLDQRDAQRSGARLPGQRPGRLHHDQARRSRVDRQCARRRDPPEAAPVLRRRTASACRKTCTWPTSAMLVDRAFRLKREHAATQYQDAELPLVMAQRRQRRRTTAACARCRLG